PPYEFHEQNVALSFTAALLVGVCASFIPATRASKIEPVVALKDE
ncbi:MAG: ABC transporter permease, partial [Kamptonema sp. SIO4C4]|nr:ABC transporter permease [Kamptonema sp. SIO4C4]